MTQIKNKFLILLSLFSVCQHTYLFTMQDENDPVYQDILTRLNKVPNFSDKNFKFKQEMVVINSFLDSKKHQDTDKNFKTIKLILKKIRPETSVDYIQQMDATYKYQDNKGESYVEIKTDSAKSTQSYIAPREKLIEKLQAPILANESVANQKRKILYKKIQNLNQNDNSIDNDKFTEEINEAAKLWKELGPLHVNNAFERIFNWFAPSYEDLSQLRKTLAPFCHTDKLKNSPHAAEFTELLQQLTLEEQRKNQLVEYINSYSLKDIKAVNHFIKEELLPIICYKQELAYKQQLLIKSQQRTIDDKARVDLNKIAAKVACDVHIQNDKSLEYLRKTGRLNDYEN